MKKHTAGPWDTKQALNGRIQALESGKFVCHLEGMDLKHRAECRANARIMAAAPDMLKTLEGWAAEQECVCEYAELEPGTCLYCDTMKTLEKAKGAE